VVLVRARAAIMVVIVLSPLMRSGREDAAACLGSQCRILLLLLLLGTITGVGSSADAGMIWFERRERDELLASA